MSHKCRQFIWGGLVCGLVVCLSLCFPDPAHAGYLDPGSGSSLVQGIIAVVAAVKRFWKRLTGLFGGKKEQQ